VACRRVPRLGTPWGLSLVDYMREVAGIGLAARTYGAQWFGDGGHPTKVIVPTATLATKVPAAKAAVLSAVRGSREPVVIPKTVGLEDWQENPSEAALVDVLTQNSTDVAHFLGIPPSWSAARAATRSTYANVESRVLNLLRVLGDSFWMVKLEEALTRQMPRPRVRPVRRERRDADGHQVQDRLDHQGHRRAAHHHQRGPRRDRHPDRRWRRPRRAAPATPPAGGA